MGNPHWLTSGLIIFQLLHLVTSILITDEMRLHNDLFDKKDKKTPMPVADGEERQVKVTIGLTLNQVVDVVSSVKILFFCQPPGFVQYVEVSSPFC